jgi:hypothetical protein
MKVKFTHNPLSLQNNHTHTYNSQLLLYTYIHIIHTDTFAMIPYVVSDFIISTYPLIKIIYICHV